MYYHHRLFPKFVIIIIKNTLLYTDAILLLQKNLYHQFKHVKWKKRTIIRKTENVANVIPILLRIVIISPESVDNTMLIKNTISTDFWAYTSKQTAVTLKM